MPEFFDVIGFLPDCVITINMDHRSASRYSYRSRFFINEKNIMVRYGESDTCVKPSILSTTIDSDPVIIAANKGIQYVNDFIRHPDFSKYGPLERFYKMLIGSKKYFISGIFYQDIFCLGRRAKDTNDYNYKSIPDSEFVSINTDSGEIRRNKLAVVECDEKDTRYYKKILEGINELVFDSDYECRSALISLKKSGKDNRFAAMTNGIDSKVVSVKL